MNPMMYGESATQSPTPSVVSGSHSASYINAATAISAITLPFSQAFHVAIFPRSKPKIHGAAVSRMAQPSFITSMKLFFVHLCHIIATSTEAAHTSCCCLCRVCGFGRAYSRDFRDGGDTSDVKFNQRVDDLIEPRKRARRYTARCSDFHAIHIKRPLAQELTLLLLG